MVLIYLQQQLLPGTSSNGATSTTNKCVKKAQYNITHTYLSASTFFGGLPRNKNLLDGISGISSGLTVEKNCGGSSSFLLNDDSTHIREKKQKSASVYATCTL